jgi:hypothetical protein
MNSFVSTDESGAQDCHYPLVQVRGRANIGDGTSNSTTYRIDFDGYDPVRITLRDLAGPWDFSNGDLPNVYMESVTLDTSSPICQPVGGPGG